MIADGRNNYMEIRGNTSWTVWIAKAEGRCQHVHTGNTSFVKDPLHQQRKGAYSDGICQHMWNSWGKKLVYIIILVASCTMYVHRFRFLHSLCIFIWKHHIIKNIPIHSHTSAICPSKGTYISMFVGRFGDLSQLLGRLDALHFLFPPLIYWEYIHEVIR